jgi:hypothetical protein
MGLFGTGSYKVMSTWPPRLLRLCCGGQIIVRTNPSQSVRHTWSHAATPPIPSLLCTLLPSDCVVLGLDSACFREFPVCQGLEAGSSPTLGTCFRRSEGFWPSDCAQILFYGPLRGPFLVGGRGCGRVPLSLRWAPCLCSCFFMVGWARGYMTCEGFEWPEFVVKTRFAPRHFGGPVTVRIGCGLVLAGRCLPRQSPF